MSFSRLGFSTILAAQREHKIQYDDRGCLVEADDV
jgi:hypothetical protein